MADPTYSIVNGKLRECIPQEPLEKDSSLADIDRQIAENAVPLQKYTNIDSALRAKRARAVSLGVTE